MANNFKVQNGIEAPGEITGAGVNITGDNDLTFNQNGSRITEQRPGEGYEFFAVPTVTVTGDGYGATVNVFYGAGDTSYSSVNINDAGQGYNIGDQLKITGDLIGGETPANDIIIEITSLSNAHAGPWAAEGSNIISGTPPTYEDGLHVRVNGTEWTFGNDYSLKLPGGLKFSDGTVQETAAGAPTEITNTDGTNNYSVSVGTDGVVSMTTSRGGLEFGALPEVGGTQHLHIMRPAGQEGATDLYFGDDYNYVKLPGLYGAGSQGVEIGSSFSNGAVSTWKFSTDGTFVPGTDNLQDIGTPTARVRHIYVGPGSVTIGDSVISESTTGKLVLPGVTRATSLYADEVEDTGDQTYAFATAPVVIDAALYDALLNSLDTSHFADYTATLDGEGYIDNIQVNGTGAYSQAEADIAKGSMYAYVGTDPDRSPFVAQDWMQIPFRVRTKANDVEYEFNTGGGSSALEGLDDVQLDGPSNGQVLTWNGSQEKWENQNPQGGGGNGNALVAGYYSITLNSDNGYLTTNYDGSDLSIIFPRENDLVIDSLAGSVVLSAGDSKEFYFTSAGVLQLPPGGDIKDSNGNSVLGGGGSGINFDADGALNLVNNGVIRNTTDSENVNIVGSGNYIQLQWTTDAGAAEADPNMTSELSNYLWVDDGGASIQTNANGLGGDHRWKFNTDGGLEFPDGSTQTTAYTGGGGSTTKTWTPPGSNPWRIEEYSGGWAGGYDYPIAEISYTLVESQTDVNYFFIDTSAYPEQWQAIQWAEEYVINGVTVGATGYGVTSFPSYNISLGSNVTYSSGDTVTIRYRNRNASPEPAVWWDAANSNSGNSDFRGAIIEYHAYCGNSGTAVGKIIISCDNNMAVSHEEALMGSDMAQYEFWMQGETGQLKVRRIGTDSNNDDNQIWIQWTGKIFYGSDYYC